MNSIESLRLNFSMQIKELSRINNDKISDDLIFVGSGDSYVAGLMVEYITGHKCVCYSASDLLNSRFNDAKTYCFISVTGRTKANINVARLATRAGVNTIAVTLNQDSKLARACKSMVPLDLKSATTPIPSFSNFTTSVVTCLQLAGVAVPKKFDTWYNKGIKLAQDFSLSKTLLDRMEDLVVFILGNNMLYPLALYTSLKMTEFFGTTAVAHKLEEFCHSPIFGIKKSHQLWILGQKEELVAQKLDRLGSKISYIELYNQEILSQLFESIFFIQNLMLFLAEKGGHTELKYLTMKKFLKASSDIIYLK